MMERMMIENKDLQQLVLQYSSYTTKIYDNTSISRDLNIQDDVAFEFIEAYSKQFNVDISSFNFIKYFPLNDQDSNPQIRIDLTIGDLIRGIKTGELNDDVIAFDENDPNLLPPKFTTSKIIWGVIFVLIVSLLLGYLTLHL